MALPLAAPARARAAASRKTFVLVHGTWLGGWIWADVAAQLRAQGHRVYTPTLTGVGERHHLISPQVGLQTHIDDIANLIRWEELGDVTLVAHSFSGVAATGVCDALRDRIRRVVFFDALIPAGNRLSGLDRAPDGSLPNWWLKRQAKFVDGYKMDYFAEYPVEMLVPASRPDIVAMLKRRLTPHPAKAWVDQLLLKNGGWNGLPRTCIRAMAQAVRPSSDKMWGPGRGPGWDMIELPVTRMGMLTEPAITTDCLAGLA